MQFSLTAEQRLVRDTAEDFLRTHSDSESVRAAMESPLGYDQHLWKRICSEMGWQGMSIPEDCDGLGLPCTTMSVVLEQTGRFLLCSPLFSSLCMATHALLLARTRAHAADAALVSETLSSLARGESTAALGWMRPDSASYDAHQTELLAEPTKDGYVLQGELHHVLHGASADLLVLAARAPDSDPSPPDDGPDHEPHTPRIALFLLPADTAGLERTTASTMDQTRPRARITCNNVRLGKQALIAPFEHGLQQLQDTLRLSGIALAAEQTGVAEECLKMSVAYAGDRVQFARPIASFQAIKHKCADMMLKVESMRSASWYGACVAQDFIEQRSDPAEFSQAAALTQSYCTEHCLPCAAESIQIHGGIGFTWEHDAHLYFKRAQSSQVLLGDSAWHKEQLACLVLDRRSPPLFMNRRRDETHDDFRKEVTNWLEQNLCGPFEKIRFRGGPGDEHMFFEERHAWEKRLAEGGWTGLSWHTQHGGRGFDIARQLVFHEEYARAGGPGRVGHIGETLLGPTLIAYGTDAQRARFLPRILSGEDLWCQGYSEPNAGSDLSNVKTRARLDKGSKRWIINGQKVWTSLAESAHWCFVLARCAEGSTGSRGLCYLLVPMDQKGVIVRPIRQMTGTSEFNEVFFEEAETDADNIVGAPGDGWKVALGTLRFERGVSTIGQQVHFYHELEELIDLARQNARARDPVIRQRLGDAWVRLAVMRYNILRVLADATADELPPAARISKLYWSEYHRDFGQLAMDVLGPAAELLSPQADHQQADDPQTDYALNRLQSIYLYTRADTIYAGTSEIQRNIIAERALGMPREPVPPPAASATASATAPATK